MATLTVWKFDTPDGAATAADEFRSRQQQELIKIQDAATVSWPADAKKPKTRQLNDLTSLGALDGAFWGMLFGILFFVPVLGLLVGAAAGALTGALSDVGIDDNFIDRVRGEVTPGTSALFLLSTDAVVERLTDVVSGATLIASNLSDDQVAKLNEAFSA